MAESNFVRWASASGALMMPIEKYKQAASIGIVPGIADLEQANRSWHQATAIGAAFGQLVIQTKGEYQGVDFKDTDTDAQLAEKIFAVFAKRLPSEIPDGCIKTAKLADESVTLPKLAKHLDFGKSEIQIKGMPLADLKKATLRERELAVATDTFELFVGDGKTPGGHQIGGDQTGAKFAEIEKTLALLTNAVAKLGSQPQPFGA